MTTEPGKRKLPLSPHPHHLRKEAKARLAEMKARVPTARLADAQFALAREYGFPSWGHLMAEALKWSGQGERRAVIAAVFRWRYRSAFPEPDEEIEAHAAFFRVGVAAYVGFFLAAFAGVGLVFLTEAQQRGVHAVFGQLALLAQRIL